MPTQTANAEQTNESWQAYYRREIENVQKMPGGKYNPFNLNTEAPISERYELIKRYRLLTYSDQNRQTITMYLFELEKVCRNFGFPLFFVLDFEAYQIEKRWIYNGKPLQNINGVFYRYAIKKRERMMANGTWQGENMENYTYCGANEMDV